MTAFDALSLVLSIVGIILGIASISVSYSLYRKAEVSSHRAEERIRQTQTLLERASGSIDVIRQDLTETARVTRSALDNASRALSALEADLLASSAETRASLQTTSRELRSVARGIEKQANHLEDLIGIYGDLVMAGSPDGFIQLLVERASVGGRSVTIGELRTAFRDAGRPRSEFDESVNRLRWRLQFSGPLNDDATIVRPR